MDHARVRSRAWSLLLMLARALLVGQFAITRQRDAFRHFQVPGDDGFSNGIIWGFSDC
jgi:hypothetical protein